MSDLMEKLKTTWKMEGRMEGRMEGKEEGKMEGQEETTKLFAFLLKDNRITDMTRCTTDPEYLKKLLNELNQAE